MIESGEKEQQYFEPIYDVPFEHTPLPTEFGALNTEVKEVAIKQTTSPLFNTPLTKQVIKPAQTPATGLIQVSVPKEALKIADIKLSAAKIEQPSPLLNTDIAKGIQTSIVSIPKTPDKIHFRF